MQWAEASAESGKTPGVLQTWSSMQWAEAFVANGKG